LTNFFGFTYILDR